MSAFKTLVTAGAVLIGLSALLFILAVMTQMARVEQVAIQGRFYSAGEFAAGLWAMYPGCLILTAAFLIVIGLAAYAGRDFEIRDGYWSASSNRRWML